MLAIYQADETTGSIKTLPIVDGIPSDDNFLNRSLQEGNDLFDALLDIEEELKGTWWNSDGAGSGRQSQGIKQLQSTVKFLITAHGEQFLDSYHPKIAYVRNKKSPSSNQNSTRRIFSRNTISG